MKTMRLMIKTHNVTGMKYLCVTNKEKYLEYKGSGRYWRLYLKKHGRDVSTEVLFESVNLEEFNSECRRVSYLLNVVEDDEWANLQHEAGYDKAQLERIITEDYRASLRAGQARHRANLTEEDRQKRSEAMRKQRLSMSQEKKEARKQKILAHRASGEYDYDAHFKKLSEDRKGSGNPSAKPYTHDGVTYGSISEAAEALGVPPHRLYALRQRLKKLETMG